MRLPSLTSRLALMCMLVCTVVLLLAGGYVQLLGRAWFDKMDRQSLAGELDGMALVLRRVQDLQQLPEAIGQLSVLLEVHPHVRVWLNTSDGYLLLTTDGLSGLPAWVRAMPDRQMWRWMHAGTHYHGMHQTLQLPYGQVLRLSIAIDQRHNRAFLHGLLGWLVGGLLLLGLASGIPGWLAARHALRPLHDLAQRAHAISPGSLRERVQLDEPQVELMPLVDALNEMLGRLEDAFERLQYFSSDLAHELRTPVASLMAKTEVALSRERSATSYQDALYSNLEALRSMSRLIDDMLFLARADHGRLILQRERIWLQDLLDDVLDYYQLLAEDAGQGIVVEGAAWVDGDAAMLRRALSNLLSNALRYTPSGQKVRIELQQASDAVLIRVINPGAGIALEHLAHLFERFYRADASRREGQANVGLGLAITRSIVEAHGGHIDCQSAEGLTRFCIRLPAAAGSPRPIREPSRL